MDYLAGRAVLTITHWTSTLHPQFSCIRVYLAKALPLWTELGSAPTSLPYLLGEFFIIFPSCLTYLNYNDFIIPL